MPYKPARPCKVPSCPGLTHDQSGYCDNHAALRPAARARDYRPDVYHRPGYGLEWIKARQRHLRLFPVCQLCGIASASGVHHRIPVRKGGTHADDNLLSVCASCHSRLEPRGWTKH